MVSLEAMRLLLASWLALAPAALAFAEDGYVVKADGDSVVVDLTAASGASAGRKFVVYKEGDELKHPVTGKSLGRMEEKVAEGELREVLPNYSVGAVTAAKSPLEPGLRVRLVEAPAPPPAPAPKAEPAPAAAGGSRKPSWRSPFVQLEAVDLDVADLDGDGRRDIALADSQRVHGYPLEAQGEDWKPLCSYEDKNTGTRMVSLEALDLNADGRAEVFATYHNEFFGRVETLVLDCGKDGFRKLATLPWMVRSLYDATGRRSLAAQALVPDRSFPFGAIYPLSYAEGKYRLGDKAIRIKRLDWIYSVADTGGEKAAANDPAALFYDYQGRLRAQFKKGSWSTPEAMGQTSNRVRWHDRVLKFAPRLPTFGGEKGLGGVYAVRNIPKLGGLADVFGVYGRGEIQRLRWTGIGLERDWVAETDGYIAGVASSDEPDAPAYAAVVNANGSTAVLKFTP